MRIVVFSDSHNNYAALRKIVLQQSDKTDMFFHLGDGVREFESLVLEFADKAFRMVRGNCDIFSRWQSSDMMVIAGKKIFCTHGHIFGVKGGLEDLKSEARALGADVVLFGHTHTAMTEYDDGIYYMNPGSVSQSRNGPPSYGVLDITDAGIVTFIAAL